MVFASCCFRPSFFCWRVAFVSASAILAFSPLSASSDVLGFAWSGTRQKLFEQTPQEDIKDKGFDWPPLQVLLALMAQLPSSLADNGLNVLLFNTVKFSPWLCRTIFRSEEAGEYQGFKWTLTGTASGIRLVPGFGWVFFFSASSQVFAEVRRSLSPPFFPSHSPTPSLSCNLACAHETSQGLTGLLGCFCLCFVLDARKLKLHNDSKN